MNLNSRASKAPRARVFSSIVLCFGVITAQADTIHVPVDQPSIQGAINIAVHGDTVSVAPGAYAENIDFSGKAITVESEQGAEVTVIDGGAAGAVVTYSSGESRNSKLRGFTITNGFSDEGGGIHAVAASPTIEANIIAGNSACTGGGIMLRGASALVERNQIYNNSTGCNYRGFGGGGIAVLGASAAEIVNNSISYNFSRDGAGILLWAGGDPIISKNELRGNVATRDGGGIKMLNRSDALIVQNLIVDNTAILGGGVYWLVSSTNRGPMLVQNTIAENVATVGSGVFANGFDTEASLINNIIVGRPGRAAVFCENTFSTDVPQFQNNDVYSPDSAPYDGICVDGTGANGNISIDPLFGDAPNGDYRLTSGSPAIDAAIDQPFIDLDLLSNARPVDGNGDTISLFDLGAYEAHPPSANAGPDRTVLVNDRVTLTGTSSNDLDGSITSYRWVQTGGIPAKITDPRSAMTTVISPPRATKLVIQLRVVDDLGFVAVDDVEIDVMARASSGGGGIGLPFLLTLLVFSRWRAPMRPGSVLSHVSS